MIKLEGKLTSETAFSLKVKFTIANQKQAFKVLSDDVTKNKQ